MNLDCLNRKMEELRLPQMDLTPDTITISLILLDNCKRSSQTRNPRRARRNVKVCLQHLNWELLGQEQLKTQHLNTLVPEVFPLVHQQKGPPVAQHQICAEVSTAKISSNLLVNLKPNSVRQAKSRRKTRSDKVSQDLRLKMMLPSINSPRSLKAQWQTTSSARLMLSTMCREAMDLPQVIKKIKYHSHVNCRPNSGRNRRRTRNAEVLPKRLVMTNHGQTTWETCH